MQTTLAKPVGARCNPNYDTEHTVATCFIPQTNNYKNIHAAHTKEHYNYFYKFVLEYEQLNII
jgi:hypothetical protein